MIALVLIAPEEGWAARHEGDKVMAVLVLTDYFDVTDEPGWSLYTLKDNAPRWLTTVCRALHGRDKSSDWILEQMYLVCGYIDYKGDDFDPRAWALSNTHNWSALNLTTWLGYMHNTTLLGLAEHQYQQEARGVYDSLFATLAGIKAFAMLIIASTLHGERMRDQVRLSNEVISEVIEEERSEKGHK